MPYPSAVDVIDTLSPLITLGFGVFCAVNDTKPKDGKLSRAGKVALWGLIISGTISLIVKGNSLRQRLADEEAKTILLEKQKKEKAETDAKNAAFEKATSDTLKRSVAELGNIRQSSATALASLDAVAEKQRLALENTRRGLNPLFPLKITLSFVVDMDAFYKKHPSETYRRDIDLYLDTLVYYETRKKIPMLLQIARHSNKEPDTVNIPKDYDVNPWDESLPEAVQNRFQYAKNTFTGLFLTRRFTVDIRRPGMNDNLLSLHFDAGDLFNKIMNNLPVDDEKGSTAVHVDMEHRLIYAEITVHEPEIKTGAGNDAIVSLYDLQNAIIGLQMDGLISDPSILKSATISMYTGYKFSRYTGFDFSPSDTKERCCNEVYARKIAAAEIK